MLKSGIGLGTVFSLSGTLHWRVLSVLYSIDWKSNIDYHWPINNSFSTKQSYQSQKQKARPKLTSNENYAMEYILNY